jgi:hypothetical protein
MHGTGKCHEQLEVRVPRGKQIPAPRAEPTNTFLARHIGEPGTEGIDIS